MSLLLRSPALYDMLQQLAGERQLSSRLGPHLVVFPPEWRLLDIGGGTGLSRGHSATDRYVCLDVDSQKLRAFRTKWPGGLAIAADATACPFGDATFDAVLCAKVLHHLAPAQLQRMMAESARILKPGGVLVIADAVRTTRWMSRLLWRLDRGSFPRTAAEIRSALPVECHVTGWEEFRVSMRHDFVLCTARRGAAAGSRADVERISG
jgi:ubiquinone/menaquinone biosynthesis C-methylase UbiE